MLIYTTTASPKILENIFSTGGPVPPIELPIDANLVSVYIALCSQVILNHFY